eukprot:286289-Rhodomonas_salina.2
MHLDNNDLKTPPPEVIMRGTGEVLSYLRRVLKVACPPCCYACADVLGRCLARESRVLELSFLDLRTFPVEYLGTTFPVSPRRALRDVWNHERYRPFAERQPAGTINPRYGPMHSLCVLCLCQAIAGSDVGCAATRPHYQRKWARY